MIEVQLSRLPHRDPGLPGILSVLDVATGKQLFECRTLELNWEDNRKDVSAIPLGDYEIRPRAAGRFYARYAKRWGHAFALHVAPVQGRSLIMIHVGNISSGFEHPHTQGCILTGLSAGERRNEAGEICNTISQSRPAYRGLYNALHEQLSQGLAVPLSIIGDEDDEDLTRDRRDI